jgi:hypothetical protein
MPLVYSKAIQPRVGNKRATSRNFRGDVLQRSIQLYRFWFLFLRLGLDCEDNEVPIIDHVNKEDIKVKVNKKFYKDWDLDRVKEDTFDNWWDDHKYKFIEQPPTIVDELIPDENAFYLKIDKRSKAVDVMKHLRKMLDNRDASTSKYPIINQHKYLPTHMKYNVFVWRNTGYKRFELLDALNKSYKYYDVRIPGDESSVRRLLRSSEKLVISTAKGVF